MTIHECIKQLESLRAHCDAMYDGRYASDETWNEDVEALDMAIEILHPNRVRSVNGGDYISRKALIEWLLPYVHFGEMVDPDSLIEDIRAMKAADVAPVRHGVWEPIIDGFGCLEGWIHPECGRTTKEASQYCPTCGAEMSKED